MKVNFKRLFLILFAILNMMGTKALAWGEPDLGARLVEISVANDGTLWGVASNQTVWRSTNGGGTWGQLNGAYLTNVAAGPNGTAYGVSASQLVWAFNGSVWREPDPDARLVEISVANDGTLWGVAPNQAVWRSINEGGTWGQLPGAALINVAAGPNGTAYGVSASQLVWAFNGSVWREPDPDARLVEISVANDGTLWGVASNQTVWQSTDGGGTWAQVGGSLIDVAAGPNGTAYGVNASQLVWAFAPASSSQPPPPPPTPSTGTVLLTSFGSVGKGSDDTGVFKSALSSTSSKGQVLEIPAGGYNINPINLPSNTKIKCDSGVKITGELYEFTPTKTPLQPTIALISIDGATNVTITGASASSCVIVNSYQSPQSTSAKGYTEWAHCLGILDGASNVNISGISCTSNSGDGMDIARASNVTVSNSIFDGNFRNNVSITGSANNITLNGNHMDNADRTGIDIEPEGGTATVRGPFITNIVLNNNTTNSNGVGGSGGGLSVGDYDGSNVSVTVNNHVSNYNGGAGYFVENTDITLSSAQYVTTPGLGNCTSSSCFVTFNNCSTDHSGGPGAYARMNAQGWMATFNNLKVTNANQKGPDHYDNEAPIGISVYQEELSAIGATPPNLPGNAVFNNLTISGQAYPSAGYFNFEGGTANSSFSCASCTGGSGATSFH